MKTSTLIRVLLGMSFVWLVLLGPAWWNFHVIGRHADGYRTAMLTVESSHCEGNLCRLHGTIEDAEAKPSP